MMLKGRVLMACGDEAGKCKKTMNDATGVVHYGQSQILDDYHGLCDIYVADFETTIEQERQVVGWDENRTLMYMFLAIGSGWNWAEDGRLAKHTESFEERLPKGLAYQKERAKKLAKKEAEEDAENARNRKKFGVKWDELQKDIESSIQKEKKSEPKLKLNFYDGSPLNNIPDNVTDDWLLGCAKSLLMIRGDTAWTAKEAKKLNGIEVRITELCKNRGLDVPVMKTDEQIAIENRQIAVNAIADSAKALPDNEANNQRLLGIKDVKSMLEEVLAVHPNANGKTSITLDELTRILMHKN